MDMRCRLPLGAVVWIVFILIDPALGNKRGTSDDMQGPLILRSLSPAPRNAFFRDPAKIQRFLSSLDTWDENAVKTGVGGGVPLEAFRLPL
jgi:hypothetical protein